MKRIAWILPALALWAQAAVAGEYVMRVDGLACPFCAYGVEKKLKRLEGVRAVDVDLDRGLVTVEVADGVRLDEARIETLIRDAGFTYRGTVAEPQ